MSEPSGTQRTPEGPAIATAVLGTVALGAVGAVVGAVSAGAPAAWGVVVGALITVVVFSVGMGVTNAAARLTPALSLLVALLTYLLQLLLLVVVLVWLERSTLLEATLERRWIGATIIVGTLVWSAALVRASFRSGSGPETAEVKGSRVP